MAISVSDLASSLERKTKWQKTPMPLSEFDYVDMVKDAIKKLYIDTGRASVFHSSMFKTDIDGEVFLQTDLPIDEEAYVMLCAQLGFFERVATDVNNIVGYVTDAMTVTNADKPYANLKDTMDRLERERRICYYKMARYTIAS